MGNADAAQRLYLEARGRCAQAERSLPLYNAVITACCLAVRQCPPHQRQRQLVLSERAFAVYEDLLAAGIRPTADTHHLLMACAAYAQHLRRAWEIFEEHLVSPRPRVRCCVPARASWAALLGVLLDCCWWRHAWGRAGALHAPHACAAAILPSLSCCLVLCQGVV